MIRHFITTAAAALVLGMAGLPAAAQSDQEVRNIGIITGPIGSTTVQLGEDMARTISGDNGVRVRTMMGKGSLTAIDDLLYLRGVDLALVTADILENIRLSEPNSPALNHLAYVARVADAELHLLVRRESGIDSIYDLEGRTVSLGNDGNDTSLTPRLVLRILDVDVEAEFLYKPEAIEALIAGDVDAAFMVGLKPMPILQNIDGDDGLRLIGIPFNDALSGLYDESQFSSEDYGTIIEDKFVETLSVPVVMAVYNKFARNSYRYNNLQAFADAFIDAVPALQERRAKWQELDLSAEVNGWPRYAPFENFANAN